jgi:hypothetical protein
MYFDQAKEHYNNFSNLFEDLRSTKTATPTLVATPTLKPTPSPIYASTPIPTPAPTTTPKPSFEFFFAIVGVLAAIFLIKRKG